MIELSPCLAADKLLPQKALRVRLKHLPHHTEAHRGRERFTQAEGPWPMRSWHTAPWGSFESCYIHLMPERDKPTRTEEVGWLETAARPLLAG